MQRQPLANKNVSFPFISLNKVLSSIFFKLSQITKLRSQTKMKRVFAFTAVKTHHRDGCSSQLSLPHFRSQFCLSNNLNAASPGLESLPTSQILFYPSFLTWPLSVPLIKFPYPSVCLSAIAKHPEVNKTFCWMAYR